MLLGRNSQGGELLVVVLNLKRSAVGDKSAIRKADTQRGADLRAFNSKAVIVLAVHVTRKHQVVLKDLQSLSGDHVDCKNAISHWSAFQA